MNQEQIKNKLIMLRSPVKDFKVTLSGKQSRKVDGLYKPDLCEIIIHNDNFNSDNPLIYTAIHEYAHHIQFTESPVKVSSRAHTSRFWLIFHEMLKNAEALKIYINVFKSDPRFIEITGKIRENFINVDANLMKEMGMLLLEAYKLCRENHASFDDYADRELQLHRRSAKTIMNIYTKDVSTDIGFENMKTVAKIRDSEKREMTQEAFLRGESPDVVNARFIRKPEPESALEYLLEEKRRIEKSIERLNSELKIITVKISESS